MAICKGKYDVIILGGGIAGSICAWQIKLRNPHANIMLVDDQLLPHRKPCSTFLFQYIMQYLPDLIPSVVYCDNTIHTFQIDYEVTPNRQQTVFPILNLQRDLLDEWLFSYNQQIGIECISNLEFKSYAVGQTYCKVFFWNKTTEKEQNIDATLIIDAMGKNSSLIQYVQDQRRSYMVYSKLLYIKDTDTTLSSNILYLLTGNSFSDKYGSWIAKKNDLWVLGCRASTQQSCDEHIETTLAWLDKHYKLTSKPIFYEEAQEKHYYDICYGKNRIIPIGDALYTNSYRIFNCDMAILSAWKCAEAVTKSLWHYDHALTRYTKLMKKIISSINDFDQIGDHYSASRKISKKIGKKLYLA